MPEEMMKNEFKVMVDDNYHSMGDSDCYTAGTYGSLEEAVDKCKEITVKSLEHHYEEGISPEKLSAQWAMFGDDPFVYTGVGSVPFSARKFVTTELCQAIIDSKLAQ